MERCSFLFFLERRAESGLVGAEYVVTQKKGERAWDIDTRAINCLVHFLLFIAKISTRRSELMLNFFWVTEVQLQICLTWTDFYTVLPLTSVNFSNQLWLFGVVVTRFIISVGYHTERDKWVHGSNGHTITSHQLVRFSCSWLFLTCDIGKKGVKGPRCLPQLALSVAAQGTGDEGGGQWTASLVQFRFSQGRFGTVCEVAPEADAAQAEALSRWQR